MLGIGQYAGCGKRTSSFSVYYLISLNNCPVQLSFFQDAKGCATGQLLFPCFLNMELQNRLVVLSELIIRIRKKENGQKCFSIECQKKFCIC